MKDKQPYTIELFFYAGDIRKQENFLIYPKSLDEEDYQELLETICAPFEQEFRNAGIHQVHEIEKRLKENQTYPDPIENKETSKCFIAQIKKGAVVFRYGYDGRREQGTNRIQYTMEGFFLKGIDLQKTKERYQKIGIDIIKELESKIPSPIEELLTTQKQELFNMVLQKHFDDNLNNLYNDFYVACEKEEIAVDKTITTSPLYTTSLVSKMEYIRKKVFKEFFML